MSMLKCLSCIEVKMYLFRTYKGRKTSVYRLFLWRRKNKVTTTESSHIIFCPL